MYPIELSTTSQSSQPVSQQFDLGNIEKNVLVEHQRTKACEETKILDAYDIRDIDKGSAEGDYNAGVISLIKTD